MAKKAGQQSHLRYKPGIQTVLEGFNVYPVPLDKEGIWLGFPEAPQDRKLQIRIFDMQGKTRTLETIHVGRTGGQHFWKLNHQDWPACVYILSISGIQLIHQKKLIKLSRSDFKTSVTSPQ